MVYEKKEVCVHERESTFHSPAQSVMAATLCSCTVTLWDFNSQACRSSLTPKSDSVTDTGLCCHLYLHTLTLVWCRKVMGKQRIVVCQFPDHHSMQARHKRWWRSVDCSLCSSHRHVFPANKHRSYIQTVAVIVTASLPTSTDHTYRQW